MSVSLKNDVILKHLNDPKTLMEYSTHIKVVYKSIGDHSPKNKRKVLIVINEIPDVICNEILHSVVTEVFIRG